MTTPGTFTIDGTEFTISASKRAFTARKGDRILAIYPYEWMIGWGYSIYFDGELSHRSRVLFASEEEAARAAMEGI